MKHLTEFFAVTINRSVYRVSYDEASDQATVEKIANGIAIDATTAVGTKLKIDDVDYVTGENYVGITSLGIILYYGFHRKSKGERRPLPEFVNTRYWGGKTSVIVGLFLKQHETEVCAQETNLKFQDDRWKKETKEVLDLIGYNHPRFIISTI